MAAPGGVTGELGDRGWGAGCQRGPEKCNLPVEFCNIARTDRCAMTMTWLCIGGREESTKHEVIHNAVSFLCWNVSLTLEVRGTLGLMERAGPVLLPGQRRDYTALFDQPGSQPEWFGSFRWLCSDGHANLALNLFVLVLVRSQLRWCCPGTASPGLTFGPSGGFGLLVSKSRRKSCTEEQRFCNWLAQIGHGTQRNPTWDMIYWVTCNCMAGFNKQKIS